ncbi:MAG TPA: hypothetical protein VG456_11890 [Candidatus Sulfopaludibacter sp.]|jgi:hypothetical protein|nr:hypothetical protein [Candidatus Sulfopaludibacter sp.]
MTLELLAAALLHEPLSGPDVGSALILRSLVQDLARVLRSADLIRS